MAAVFGYGSLVNAATHGYEGCAPVRLKGWRRVWVHSAHRKVAYLSVTPCEVSTIDGLTALVDAKAWPALDTREASYTRVPLSPEDFTHGTKAKDVCLYRADPSLIAPPSRANPILLSYLDVVFQGYLQTFGSDGVSDFLTSTDGWDAPILDDRADPKYPRHQSLARQERALVDAALDDLGARVLRS